MNNREFLRLFSLHISFLLCPLTYGADTTKNSDTLIKESNGNWVGDIPGGVGTTTMQPLPDMPKGPQISPQAPSSNTPSTQQQPNNTAGGLLGLIIDAGKPSQAEIAKAVADKREQIKEAAKILPKGMQLGGAHAYEQFNPDPNNPVYGFTYKVKPEDFTGPMVANPVPAAQTAAKVAQAAAPVVQEMAKNLTLTPPPSSVPMPPAVQEIAKNLADRAMKNPADITKIGLKMDLLKKSAEMAKTASDTGSGPAPLDLLQGAGTVAGTAVAAKTGFFGGLAASAKAGLASAAAGAKAGAAYAAAGAKAAGATIWAFGQAHPFIAGGTVVVVGGTILYKALTHGRAPMPIPHTPPPAQQIVEPLAHREISNVKKDHPESHPEPKPIPEPVRTSGEPRKKRPLTEIRAQVQPGDPRLNPGYDPYIVSHAGQGKPHHFKDDWGHYLEHNPKTEAAIKETVMKGEYHGRCEAGLDIFTYKCPDTGKQRWAQVRPDGGINNGGINEVHMPICKEQKLPYTPDGFVKPKGPGHGDKLKTLVGAGAAGALASNLEGATEQDIQFNNFVKNQQWNSDLYLPDAPKDWTPEKAMKYEKKVLRKVDEQIAQYTATELDGRPYSHEYRTTVQAKAKNDLINHLKETSEL